ncbi:glycosyl transferase family 1 [Nocardioides baekrokdamisoli]|uniref:Glycosyl transferase family 1 n=1 Tax=Nocardioides baekrokdamisoli TaxID=1804624 RepID=A0A3G9IFB0_9ACTN|nr:glycosyl transferase family 1 [Nocardioides baekrokdamisoli]
MNGRFLTHPITGVERFATEITRRLLVARPDTVVVAPAGVSRPQWVPVESWRTTGRLHGHAWEQIELPAYLRRLGRPVLIGLCNTGPITYRRQVASHHDVGYLRLPSNYSWRFRTWYRVMAWLLLRVSAAVVTVSEFSRRELAEAYGIQRSKILVVPNAVGPEFSPGLQERGAYAVAVGSPSERKNIARLVEAWEHVHQQTGIELRIVGDPLLVAGSAGGLAARPGVVMVGRVTDDELIALYRGARLSILPSLYEGFGLPILESQACGCPVIAADAASLPEVLDGSGLLFDPYDSSAITDAALRVLTDPLLAGELAEAGERNVRRFSWDDSMRQVLAAAEAPS